MVASQLVRQGSQGHEVTDNAPCETALTNWNKAAKATNKSGDRLHAVADTAAKKKPSSLSFKFTIYAASSEGEGGLDKTALVRLLKDVGVTDTLETRQGWPAEKLEKFIDLQFANADIDSNGVIDRKEFGRYYESLVDYCKALGIASAEMEAAAAKSKATQKKKQEEADNTQTVALKLKYGVVDCHLKHLNEQIKETWEKEKKTPVVLGPDDVLNTFFLDEDEGEYAQEVVPLDAKRMVYERSVLKHTSEEVLERARRQTLIALNQGCTLLVFCSNASPDFNGDLQSPTEFPSELFKAGWLDDKKDKYTTNYESIVKKDCEFDRSLVPDFSTFKSTPGYRVVLTSGLKVCELDSLAENLATPLENYKFIRVKR